MIFIEFKELFLKGSFGDAFFEEFANI